MKLKWIHLDLVRHLILIEMVEVLQHFFKIQLFLAVIKLPQLKLHLQNGFPQVNITLDGEGGSKMHRATRGNIGKRLAFYLLNKKQDYLRKRLFGKQVPVQETYEVKEIISLATIRAALGTTFRITGLDSPSESSELALLLRAGALAAPMTFVEERTVGPSLGADNIQAGIFNATRLTAGIGIYFILLQSFLWLASFGLT